MHVVAGTSQDAVEGATSVTRCRTVTETALATVRRKNTGVRYGTQPCTTNITLKDSARRGVPS